jgi:hypothetical protein
MNGYKDYELMTLTDLAIYLTKSLFSMKNTDSKLKNNVVTNVENLKNLKQNAHQVIESFKNQINEEIDKYCKSQIAKINSIICNHQKTFEDNVNFINNTPDTSILYNNPKDKYDFSESKHIISFTKRICK